MKKLLESAIANAEHNENADIDKLFVKSVIVNQGLRLKRMKPRARGRADRNYKANLPYRNYFSGRRSLMGQKVHPTGMRLGIIKKHNANWYAKGKDYPKFLNEDLKVREFIGTKLKFSSISKVELDRSAQAYVVNIHSSRPGIIIGKKGEEIENLKKQIKKIVNLPTQVNIKEVRKPDLDATEYSLNQLPNNLREESNLGEL